MPTLLLIDDDAMITGPVSRTLNEAGFETLVAHDGTKGLALAREARPDLVVLDIMLPGLDGWAVCRELRAHSSVPILMLTALGDEVDRVLGLELGADDYLTKPFSMRELAARVRALLRRVELEQARRFSADRISIGQVTLEINTRRVWKGETELALRFKEFELLTLLMSRAGEAVTRADLFDQVWGTDWLGDTRTLDVHVRWLREKIETDPSQPRYIQTVRGVGYRFATPEEAAS